jgi:hypothetical protein
MSITACTLNGNSCPVFGGGALTTWTPTGNTTIINSTITGNIASGAGNGYGGGICNGSGGKLYLTNCTVSGNTASSVPGGGGIENKGTKIICARQRKALAKALIVPVSSPPRNSLHFPGGNSCHRDGGPQRSVQCPPCRRDPRRSGGNSRREKARRPESGVCSLTVYISRRMRSERSQLGEPSMPFEGCRE